MKIVVYTCITGNYDKLIELDKKEKDVDYICFTNNRNLKSKTWNITYLEEDLDNWTLSRKVKIMFYEYLPEHNLSIWIDGAVKIIKPVSEFIKKECDLENHDMVVFKHQFRDCIYDELNSCVELNKDKIENIKKIETLLKKEKYPKHNGLVETTILVRKNVDSVKDLMKDWFDKIVNYTKRDQLSFNYCQWKRNIKLQYLDAWAFDNDYFKHMGHQKIAYLNYRILFSQMDKFDFHLVIDDKIEIIDNKVRISHTCPKKTNTMTLYLFDEIGSIIKNLKINKTKTKIEYINTRNINDAIIFYDTPVIVFNGDFDKSDKITIEFEIIRNSRSVLVEKIYIKDLELKTQKELIKEEMQLQIDSLNNKLAEKNKEIDKQLNDNIVLKQQYDDLYKVYDTIMNSKSWKLISKIRNIKKK